MELSKKNAGLSVKDGDKNQRNNPLVSILTPVLNANANKYLEQCIQSVLNQTYSNIEHIFADGGSTDGTLETLANYQVKYPNRIRFISETDKGVGSALKKAYKISRGEIIGWIDSDDIYEPVAVETAIDYYKKTPEAHFVYGGCNLINAMSEVIGCFVIRDFDKKEWLNVWHYIVFCAIFFKRDVIEKVGFVNDLGNDLYFYLKVAKKFKMHRIEKTLTNWRLHEDGISLKKADRENSIRRNRAKEDFFLVLKHGGSIFSPRALIYFGVLESSIAKKLGPFLGFLSPVLRKLDYHLKSSMYVANRKGGSYAYPLFKNICNDFLKSVMHLFVSVKSYENQLYNSASDGYLYCRAGQRINRISAGSVVSQVRLYMDKVGDPKGTGSCVVRKVSDDLIVGNLGTVDIDSLPDVSAPHPKWVLFNTADIKIPNKGDYRIVFEWDTAGGDSSNYPRVRYNNTNTITGVFTQYASDGKWADQSNSDTSIRMRIN